MEKSTLCVVHACVVRGGKQERVITKNPPSCKCRYMHFYVYIDGVNYIIYMHTYAVIYI